MLGILEDTQAMVKAGNVRQLVAEYLSSTAFRKLGKASQQDYHACLGIIKDDVGHVSLSRLDVPMMQRYYDAWLTRGTYRANKIAAIMSILINWGNKNSLNLNNPMPFLDKTPNPSRKVIWEPGQVKLFLDTAYSEWKWRSIGLIVHMAYEWGQRVGDMRLLKWSSFDLEKQRVDLTQSKRGEDVHLPISAALHRLLTEQKDLFGFQPYVAPQIEARDGAYKPYIKPTLHKYVNQVLAKANLPDELTAMDMRRTAITEMVEAGVDITQIKQVSGHTNINSLTPYINHTFTGASEALAQRTAFKEK